MTDCDELIGCWPRQRYFCLATPLDDPDVFDAARHMVMAMCPSHRRLGRTVKGFIKALVTRGLRQAVALHGYLRQMVVQVPARDGGRSAVWVMSFDGSQADRPHMAANETAFGCGGIFGE